MNERDLIPLETGEVHRTPASRGDRLMVALAVVALTGGLVIAVGNLTSGPDSPIALASAGPSSPATPERTQRPAPTERPLEQILVAPGDPPEAVDPHSWSQIWIRAREELVVRALPQADGFQVGVMSVGGVAQAQASDGTLSVPGWLYVLEPEPSGWVQVDDGQTILVDRYEPDLELQRRLYVQVVAGQTGFVAGRPDGSFAISPDGATWKSGPPGGIAAFAYGSVAEGPAGWLAEATVPEARFDRANPFLWRSSDGLTWTPLGRMETGRSGFWVNGIWGSPMGYLLWGSRDIGGDTFWFSINGISWSELPPTGLPRDGWFQVISTPFGFYVRNGEAAASGAVGAFTADGATWQLVEDGPREQAPWITPIEDELLAIARDPATDTLQVWSGRVGGGGFSWRRIEASSSTFDGMVPALLTGNGRRAVLIAWDRETERIQSWSSADGVTWAELAFPAGGFGIIPHGAVGAAAGVLVYGQVRVGGVPSIQLWRLAGNGWQAVPGSAVLGLSPANVGQCPDPPSDFLAFLVMEGSRGAYCFGDAPISFRAYSVGCEGCSGGEGRATPAWLANSDPPLFLLPYEGANPPWLNLALDPSLQRTDAWTGTWLDVVGHYDDPAALDCRLPLAADDETWYSGRQQLVEECRSRFVITGVTVVDGP